MSNLTEHAVLLNTLKDLGPPNEVQDDPRAGKCLGWGTRETGLFSIFTGPIDESYEIFLKDANGSVIVHEWMCYADLNRWGANNLELIRRTLGQVHE